MLTADELEVLGTLRGPVVVVTGDDQIAHATGDALALFGWDESLIGRPLTTIIPQRLHQRHLDGFQRYVETGVSRLQGGTVRVPALRRDSTEVEMDLTIRVFQRPDGSRLAVAALSKAALGKPPAALRILEKALIKRVYALV